MLLEWDPELSPSGSPALGTMPAMDVCSVDEFSLFVLPLRSTDLLDIFPMESRGPQAQLICDNLCHPPSNCSSLIQ